MKKIFSFIMIVSIIFNLFSFTTNANLEENNENKKNYIFVGKNYYKDDLIKKGFLDKIISDGKDGNEETVSPDIFQKFLEAVEAGKIKYEKGWTFNQYFLANNISPEDNFSAGNNNHPLVELYPGVYLNAHLRAASKTGITYVGPADYKGGKYWQGDKYVSNNPKTFARLTLGNLENFSPSINDDKTENYSEAEGKLGYFSRDNYSFPNRIGYGEDSSVIDYMLTPENNFSIPTRFNEKRDDVYLTMRSHGFFGDGIPDAQAYLTAVDSENKNVGSSEEDEKYFINTTSNIFITHNGWDQLGTVSKGMVVGHKPNNSFYWDKLCTWSSCGFSGYLNEMLALNDYDEQNKLGNIPLFQTLSKNALTGISVSEFVERLNEGLKRIQASSSANTIVSGSGGQIRLEGFFRKSPIDEKYLSTEEERLKDSENIVDVKYYMYVDNKNENTRFLSAEGKYLYSPNEAVFKIETTRPFFKEFGDLEEQILFSEEKFSETLGLDSFNLQDNGYFKNGEKIGVDDSRVRVRIKMGDEGYSDEKFEISELLDELKKEKYFNKEVLLAYTYAGVDSDDKNIGLLPSEIEDNTGAYAVPIVRKVKIEKSKFEEYHKYFLEDATLENETESFSFKETENDKISTEKILKNNERNYKLQKITKIISDFEGNIESEEVLDSAGDLEEFDYETGKILKYVYEYTILTGTLTVKYLEEGTNKELLKEEVSKEEEGTDYKTEKKEVEGYSFVKVEGEEEGKYESGDLEIIYYYKKNPEIGTLTVKYLEEGTNKELLKEEVSKEEEGTDYKTEKKEIEGYTFVKVEGEEEGKYESGDLEIIYYYKKNPEIGTLTVKYLEEGTNKELLKEEITKEEEGTDYKTEKKEVEGYSFVKVEGKEEGKYESGDLEIIYYYKKKSSGGSSSGGKVVSSGEVKDSPEVKITEKVQETPKIPELPKTEEIKIPENKTPSLETNVENKTLVVFPSVPKDFEPISPIEISSGYTTENLTLINTSDFELDTKQYANTESYKGESFVKKYFPILPKTGVLTSKEIYDKVGLIQSSQVETSLGESKIFDLAGTGEKNLAVWLEKLPEEDRNLDKYLVLPSQGLIIPINEVQKGEKAYENFINGREENFIKYLETGSVELPTSTRGYGEIGNKVIGGHSSYYKNKPGRYKTHFQKIIGMEKQEEIWVYERNILGIYDRYVYKVTDSYNTKSTDVGVLKPVDKSQLTLFTCTPVGGIEGRWIVKSEFIGKY